MRPVPEFLHRLREEALSNVLSSVSFSVVIPAVILGCVVLSTPTLRTSMFNILVKVKAMVFSVCGLGQYNKNKERGKIFAILGLIFLGFAILLSVVFWAELFAMKILR